MRQIKELSDLGLIAALITLGYDYEEVVRQNTRVLFVFEWDDHLTDLESCYFNNDLEVDARSYAAVLKKVKTEIYRRSDRK